MKWITISFIFFALFIGALVVVSMREEIGLVSANYYQDELKHSEKMQRMNNAQALVAKPELSFEGNSVKVSFGQFNTIESGKLTVQRPSRAALDFQFDVPAGSAPSQYFELQQWEQGLYRVGFAWTANGSEYYIEKLLVL